MLDQETRGPRHRAHRLGAFVTMIQDGSFSRVHLNSHRFREMAGWIQRRGLRAPQGPASTHGEVKIDPEPQVHAFPYSPV